MSSTDVRMCLTLAISNSVPQVRRVWQASRRAAGGARRRSRRPVSLLLWRPMTSRSDSSSATDVIPSPNHDARTARVDILVLHYTGMTTDEEALARLTDPDAKVSSHYFVYEDGRTIQLVAEAQRAWHAGQSSWKGAVDINARSIGIEIANPGHEYGYREFPERQIEAVIALCRDIVTRHTIRRERVLAHSDVAPNRKQDPGEKFPWDRLAAA